MPDLVANPHYLNYWKSYLDIFVVDSQTYSGFEDFAKPIFESITLFDMKEGFIDSYTAWNKAENAWSSEKRPPLLELTQFDRDRGQEMLKRWSIPENAWFVALHVRETHEFDPRGGPNSDIYTYLPAIESIVSRGGWVIRMGHPGMKPLPSLPQTIDYANSEDRVDWMDVFIWASCRFFIGTSSGPVTAPPTFGKPILYTNATNMGLNPNFPSSLMLPKLFWSRRDNRYLTFKEMLDGPMAWTVAKSFEGVDGEFADNTPDEIKAAVIEMLDRLESSSNQDRLSELQQKFNDLRRYYGESGQMTISNTFAETHRDLL